ncbi:hypothetical protein BB561_005583 [Smittium simulii]|uniref:Polynucleotide 5'-hydroxyl-kinase GRC3 n=1 Tax=Smittium simulii TaxID=133385 RepID=A0A2T9Y9Q0_9FUNG|nr:hypothetical protein BB561_005583 [Smittium simulii]
MSSSNEPQDLIEKNNSLSETSTPNSQASNTTAATQLFHISVTSSEINKFLSSPYLVSTWFPVVQKNFTRRQINISVLHNNTRLAHSLVLAFKNYQKLVFQGHVYIRLLKGRVDVAGYTLALGEWIRVYSTSLEALYYIQAFPVNDIPPFTNNSDIPSSSSTNNSDIPPFTNNSDIPPFSSTNNSDIPLDTQTVPLFANYDSVIEIVQDDSGIQHIGAVSTNNASIFKPNFYIPENAARSSGTAKVEYLYRHNTSIPGFYPVWSIRNFKCSNGVLNYSNNWYQISSDLIKFSLLNQNSSIEENNFKKTSQYNNLRVIVTGKKSSGKSTFTRFVANQLASSYDSVYYLETDVGQPDMNAIGVVALHLITKNKNFIDSQTNLNCDSQIIPGSASTDNKIAVSKFIGPSFLNSVNNICSDSDNLQNVHYYQNTIVGSVFLGVITPKEIPHRYIEAIKYLVGIYNNIVGSTSDNNNRNNTSNINRNKSPLLVNTHGWVKGLGLDILADISNIVAPTHFMQMFDQASSDNVFFLDPSVMPESTNFVFVPTSLGDYGNSSRRFRNSAKSSNSYQLDSSPSTPGNSQSFSENAQNNLTTTNFENNSCLEISQESNNSQNTLLKKNSLDKKMSKKNTQVQFDNQNILDVSATNQFQDIFELDQELEEYLSSDNEVSENKSTAENFGKFSTDKKTSSPNLNFADTNELSEDETEKKQSKNIVSKQLNSNPLTIRLLSLLAHIYGTTKYGSWTFNIPLTDRIPIAVPFKSVSIWICDNDIRNSDILRLLNGSLVGVIVKYIYQEHLEDIEDLDKSSSSQHSFKVFNGWPENDWQWISHGLIRAIDIDSKSFSLLLPPTANIKSASDITRVELGFVKGPGPMEYGLELPASIFTQGGYAKQAMKLASISNNSTSNKFKAGSFVAVKPKLGSFNTPYLAIGTTEGVGSSDLKPRKNLKRRSQAN